MIAQEMNKENTNLDSGFNITWIFQWVQVVLNTWFDCISVILLVVHLTCCNSMYISMGTLLMRILICQYLRPCACISDLCGFCCGSSLGWMGVSEFWERVSFDPFGVLFFTFSVLE